MLTGLRITCVIISIAILNVFELMGLMFIMNIILGSHPVEVNAIFGANLITSLGFSIEFSFYIVQSFIKKVGSSKQIRVMHAMNEMGTTVFISFVPIKFLSIIILAFAPAQIFRLYFFRMYFFIVVLGIFNGLLFLPIVLSWIGPPTDKIEYYE